MSDDANALGDEAASMYTYIRACVRVCCIHDYA